ncbi:MAG: type II methionyl aminopeptidase [Nitrososphaeria archaeon]
MINIRIKTRDLDKLEEESYLKAGRIASQVLKEVKSKVQPGITFEKICKIIEDRSKELGGEQAFPANICLNEIAAHDTAGIEDDRTVKERDVVKLDVGIQVNGYIADTAITINFNEEYVDMVSANLEVLNLALKKVKAGESINEVGRTVHHFVTSKGYKTIANLSGHSLGQYQIHSGHSIPNTPFNGMLGRFSAGRSYAIEPFLTSKNAAAFVDEIEQVNIYSIIRRKRLKHEIADLLLQEIWEKRKMLPFSPRWFIDSYDKKDLLEALDYLVKNKMLRKYPVLKEATNQVVSQFEHTALVMENSTIITTS